MGAIKYRGILLIPALILKLKLQLAGRDCIVVNWEKADCRISVPSDKRGTKKYRKKLMAYCNRQKFNFIFKAFSNDIL